MYHYKYYIMPACGHVLEGYEKKLDFFGKNYETIARCLDDNCPHSRCWQSLGKINAPDGKAYMSLVMEKSIYKPWDWRHRREGWKSEY